MVYLDRVYRHRSTGQMHRVISITRLAQTLFEIVTVDLSFSFSWLGSNYTFPEEFLVPS